MPMLIQTGGLMLGSRLKRLSDKFLQEISAIYKNEGIEFEASWFPVFFLLNNRTEISISDIALELEISQSAVSQMVGQLEKRNLVLVTRLPRDRRIRMISLTTDGIDLLNRVLPVWEAIQSAVETMISRGSASSVFLKALGEFEQEIKTLSLSGLVRENLLSRIQVPREEL